MCGGGSHSLRSNGKFPLSTEKWPLPQQPSVAINSSLGVGHWGGEGVPLFSSSVLKLVILLILWKSCVGSPRYCGFICVTATSCPETVVLPILGFVHSFAPLFHHIPWTLKRVGWSGNRDIPSTGEHSELLILSHHFLSACEAPVLGLDPVI